VGVPGQESANADSALTILLMNEVWSARCAGRGHRSAASLPPGHPFVTREMSFLLLRTFVNFTATAMSSAIGDKKFAFKDELPSNCR
jgi:hypothetical protein